MGTYTDLSQFYMPVAHESNYEDALNPNWEVLDALPVNAKAYLKGDGTTEDAGALTDFRAAALAGKRCYIPAGNYVIPDGSSMFPALTEGLLIEGAGRANTNISTKNAYAFKTSATGAVSNVAIQQLSTSLRSGSTSGGGIKAVSDSYHAGWSLASVWCDGASTGLDPLIHVDGWIGSYMDLVFATNCGGDGITMTGGFPSNVWGLTRFRAAGCGLAGTSYAGVRVGGTGGQVGPGIVESNHCFGIHATTNNTTISGIHFEDQWNTDIYGEMYACTIERNGMYFHDASAEGASRQVQLVCTAGANQRHMNRIVNNIFPDGVASGIAIDIGTNVEDTYLNSNRGPSFSSGSILDNGTRTASYQTDNQYAVANEWKLPGGAIPGLRVKGTTQTGDGSDVSSTGLFSVADSSNQEMVGVTRKGYLVQQTPNGDPGAATTNLSGFTLFWDQAAGKVKARGRDSSGSEFVHTLSN